MTVLLVNPPAVSVQAVSSHGGQSFVAGQKERLTPSQYYSLPIEHLGIMSVAAYARSKGIEVETVNGMVDGHASVEETWQSILSVARRSGTPALIGFSNIDTFHEVLWLADKCRREWADVKIAIGNTFATLNYERILRNDLFDFVVVGEGEVSFTLLAEAVLNGGPVEAVPALAWRAPDGSTRSTQPTAVDLDEIPWAARDELSAVLRQGFAGAVFSTRGCPYRCTFCGTGAASDLLGSGSRYRLRSIENVVDEIEYLMKDFGLEFISISDDLFLTKHPLMQERAAAFANEIIRRKLRLGFMFDARVDSMADLGLFAHLKRAGLRRVFVGLETGSYEQLISYRKRHVAPGEDPAARINALQELGIEVIPGTIMFHPTVGPVELRETLRLLEATGYKAPRKLFDRITAYAGTPLYHEYAAKSYLTNDWPVGEWEFVDSNAARMYESVSEHITRNEDISFVDAADFFLARVSEWEAAVESQGGA